MQYDELVETVRDIIGEDSPDFWTANEVRRYLNEAQRRFNGEERWPWLVVEGTAQLSAGDPTLDLEEGIAYSRHVNFRLTRDGETRAYRPRKVSAQKGFELRDGYSSDHTGSYPDWFYLTSARDDGGEGAFITQVRFIPTPVADMDVEYQYITSGPDLAADPDTPLIPQDYHMAVVHYAAGMAWEKELNAESKAREQFEMYGGLVAQARDEFLTQPEDEPLIMGQEDPLHEMDRMARGDPWLRLIPDTLGP